MTDRPTVILVDDHSVVLEGLRGTLGRHGFDVVAAESTLEGAVRAASQHAPTLVVLDVRLAEGSGIDAIEPVRTASPSSVICMLTSFSNVRDARLAIELGATGYLLKDSPIEELARMLSAAAAGAFLVDPRLSTVIMSRGGPLTLTEQEVAVLELVADGLTNRQIGEQLHLSPHTVKEYLSNSMTKLGTKTRTGTVTVAFREGLLGSQP